MVLGVVLVMLGLLAVASASSGQWDTWTTKADMLTPSTFLCTGVVDGKIYVIGGSLIGAPVALTTVQAYDFSPATHASEALRKVMIFGDGPAAIIYELVMLVVLSGVILVGGIMLYQRLQLRKV